MNNTIAALVLALIPMRAAAQTAPAPAPIIPISTSTLNPSNWYKIGGAFGPKDSVTNLRTWQFGFDTGATAGLCAGWDRADKEALGGACRDLLLLAHHGQPALHLGIMYGWDSAHLHSAIVGRGGLTIGPAAASALNYIGDKIPAVEVLANWTAPAPLAYIGNISTIDYMWGPWTGVVPGSHKFVDGPELKLDIPFADIGTAMNYIGQIFGK